MLADLARRLLRRLHSGRRNSKTPKGPSHLRRRLIRPVCLIEKLLDAVLVTVICYTSERRRLSWRLFEEDHVVKATATSRLYETGSLSRAVAVSHG